jgi:hypothetical protein
VALGVAGDGQQGEAPHREAPGFVAAGVVAGGVAAVQPGGIEGQLGLVTDQAAQAGAAEDFALELAEAPFWRSRCSA